MSADQSKNVTRIDDTSQQHTALSGLHSLGKRFNNRSELGREVTWGAQLTLVECEFSHRKQFLLSVISHIPRVFLGF